LNEVKQHELKFQLHATLNTITLLVRREPRDIRSTFTLLEASYDLRKRSSARAVSHFDTSAMFEE